MTDLSSPFESAEQVIAWNDEHAQAEHGARVALLDEALQKIERSTTPQATYGREKLAAMRAELAGRLRRVRDLAPELEAERETYRKAVDECRAIRIAVQSATVATALVQAQAELTLCNRRAHAARLAFARVAGRSRLMSLPSLHPYSEAMTATRDLAAVAHEHPPSAYEGRFVHRAIELAQLQGRAMTEDRAMWTAVCEAEHARDPEAVKAFEARWFYAARKLKLESVPTSLMSSADAAAAE